MIYQAYSRNESILDLIRPLAAATGKALCLPWPLLRLDWSIRKFGGVLETFGDLAVTHERLPFGIASVAMGNRLVPVTEESIYSTPFATLLHFRKETEAYPTAGIIGCPHVGPFRDIIARNSQNDVGRS